MSLTVKGAKRVVAWMSNMDATMQANIQAEVAAYGFSLLALAQTRSPVDTGRFRAAWQLFPYYAPGTIAGIMLTNNLPYAGVLEYGSESGKRPWPSAQSKTTAMVGRIYSRQAPGGVMAPILSTVASELAQACLKGIRK